MTSHRIPDSTLHSIDAAGSWFWQYRPVIPPPPGAGARRIASQKQSRLQSESKAERGPSLRSALALVKPQ